ncbi:AAA family ATPase [Nocardia sp. NPDC004340]
MNRLLVLVNGLPGSGKTTLGAELALNLNASFLSKDIVKEGLAESTGGAVGGAKLGGIAMDTVWALARESSTDVVIDSWWFRPRDLGFARSGIERSGVRRVVEIWCDVPPEIARARYASRQRAAVHQDLLSLSENWDDWAAKAAPLGLTPVIVVDTTRTVDFADLAQRVRCTQTRSSK